jgi:outer membrane protein assembly factor BamD
MPDDWVVLPPAYEKDQSSVRDALRELDSALEKYPDSPHLPQAKESRRDVVRRLIEHEVYVARFYLERGHPKAAILRIQAALRQYPDSGREGELLLALGETHLEMGNPASARQVFLRVAKEFGNRLEVKRAELFLDFIQQRFGDNPVDKPAPTG